MERKKNNKIKILIIVVLIIFSTLFLYKKNVYELDSEIEKYTASSKTFTIMLQQEDGSYKASAESSWPSGYDYNDQETVCTDAGGSSVSGVTITYDGVNVVVTGNIQLYCTLYFDIHIYQGYCVENGITNLADCILITENYSENVSEAITYIKNKGTPDFSVTATTDEGLYYADDDYGDSYYFRGAVEDNYVYFAGYYLRVVRINGDGSVRIIYDGTEAHENGESSSTADRYISLSAFNSSYADNAYVGYMYGTESSDTYEKTHANTNDSTIKEVVDSWYETNIYNASDGTYSYDDYISDTLFCNDRSVYSGTGVGTTTTYYGAYNRLLTNKSPILTCPQPDDAFTVSDTAYGNGDLTYKVGLITADEVVMAGGVYITSNSSYYLYTYSEYWTMSPTLFFFSGTYVYAFEGYIDVSGGIYLYLGYPVSRVKGVRPVINLSSTVILTSGDGTMSSPYRISLS